MEKLGGFTSFFLFMSSAFESQTNYMTSSMFKSTVPLSSDRKNYELSYAPLALDGSWNSLKICH